MRTVTVGDASGCTPWRRTHGMVSRANPLLHMIGRVARAASPSGINAPSVLER